MPPRVEGSSFGSTTLTSSEGLSTVKDNLCTGIDGIIGPKSQWTGLQDYRDDPSWPSLFSGRCAYVKRLLPLSGGVACTTIRPHAN